MYTRNKQQQQYLRSFLFGLLIFEAVEVVVVISKKKIISKNKTRAKAKTKKWKKHSGPEYF